jgi:two-component system response regulator AtoC
MARPEHQRPAPATDGPWPPPGKTAVAHRPGDPADGIIAVDAAMIRLHETATLVARGELSVLLVGETGSGKEIVAETILRASGRLGKPFLRLNCAAVPESLSESELFGQLGGAFTGAASDKEGRLEAANGGTLLLDEVGELPMALQGKFLGLAEWGEVLSIGGRSPTLTDLRLVSTTNRNLEEEVERGRFRKDLYHRLAGEVLIIPPLRERRSEIEPLARMFLERAARRTGGTPPRLSRDSLEQLLDYDWPGNVRELRNVIERATLLCQETEIAPHHLPLERMSRPAAFGRRSSLGADEGHERASLARNGGSPSASRSEEKAQIVRALERCAGNQTQAARLLGISRSTLITRVSEYGLPRPQQRRRP